MKFLDKLRGVKSSADYEIALGEAQVAIADTTGRLATLKDALRSAPFSSSEEEVRALRQRIRDLEDDLEYAKAVAVEIDERRRQAAAAEDRAEVDRLIADAQPDLRKHAELCAGYVEELEWMAKSFIELERVQRRLFEVNDKLVSRGYPGDKLPFRQLQTGQAINQLNAVMITFTSQGNPDLGRHLRGEG